MKDGAIYGETWSDISDKSRNEAVQQLQSLDDVPATA